MAAKQWKGRPTGREKTMPILKRDRETTVGCNPYYGSWKKEGVYTEWEIAKKI
jgi:hypothetical protein